MAFQGLRRLNMLPLDRYTFDAKRREAFAKLNEIWDHALNQADYAELDEAKEFASRYIDAYGVLVGA
jgi:hypothetical protein